MNLLISAGYVIAAFLCVFSYYKGYGRGFADAFRHDNPEGVYPQRAGSVPKMKNPPKPPKMNPANGYQPLDDIETLPPGFVAHAEAKIASITAKPCEICDRLIDHTDKTCQHPKNGYCQISLNNAVTLKKFN